MKPVNSSWKYRSESPAVGIVGRVLVEGGKTLFIVPFPPHSGTYLLTNYDVSIETLDDRFMRSFEGKNARGTPLFSKTFIKAGSKGMLLREFGNFKGDTPVLRMYPRRTACACRNKRMMCSKCSDSMRDYDIEPTTKDEIWLKIVDNHAAFVTSHILDYTAESMRPAKIIHGRKTFKRK